MADFSRIERRVIVGSRFMTMIAVLGSLAGSLLMFCLGMVNIFNAFRFTFFGPGDMEVEEGEDIATLGESLAIISVIEGLDRFLIAIVLLYFSYGVYSLFIHPEEREETLKLPAWLRVKQIGQLKQVVAEVIIVVLFVLFLRVALRIFQDPNLTLSWLQMGTIALLPFCTLLLGLALRLVQLHPKPIRLREEDGTSPADPVQAQNPPLSNERAAELD